MNPLAYLAGLIADAARTLYRCITGKLERTSPDMEAIKSLDYPQHDDEKGETE